MATTEAKPGFRLPWSSDRIEPGIAGDASVEAVDTIDASDAAEALVQARGHQGPIHCLLTDVIMPHKDGFQVLREIKTDPELAHIPVVMLTVKTHNADIVQGLREGAELYLPKPFHPKELTELVLRAAEGRLG